MKRSRFWWVVELCVFWCFILSTFPVEAQEEEKPGEESKVSEEDVAQAKALFAEAEKSFFVGDLENAARLYQESYYLSKAPLLLKNIAICYEKMGKFAEARHMWEAFFRSLSPKDPYYKQAKQRMDELDLILESQLLVVKTPEVFRESLTLPEEFILTEERSTTRRKNLTVLVSVLSAGGLVVGGVLLSAAILSKDDPIEFLGRFPAHPQGGGL